MFLVEGLLVSTITANFKTTTKQSEIHKKEAKINLQGLEESQRSLRQTEELYRTLTQNLPKVAVFLFDRNLRLTSVDGPEIEVFGLSKDDFNRKNLAETVTPEIYKVLEPVCLQALEGKLNFVEFLCTNQVYLVQTLPVKDENGQISGGLAISQNITTRKEAEREIIKLNQALELKVKELETLLEVIPIGIGIHRIDNNRGDPVSYSIIPQVQTVADDGIEETFCFS